MTKRKAMLLAAGLVASLLGGAVAMALGRSGTGSAVADTPKQLEPIVKVRERTVKVEKKAKGSNQPVQVVNLVGTAEQADDDAIEHESESTSPRITSPSITRPRTTRTTRTSPGMTEATKRRRWSRGALRALAHRRRRDVRLLVRLTHPFSEACDGIRRIAAAAAGDHRLKITRRAIVREAPEAPRYIYVGGGSSSGSTSGGSTVAAAAPSSTTSTGGS
jgi:hypothetical protein